MINFFISAFLLFISGVLTDIIWALYIQKLAEKKNFQGALYSVGTGICTVIFVEGLLYSLWIMPFWLFGLFIGTYYSNRIEGVIQKIYEQTRNRNAQRQK